MSASLAVEFAAGGIVFVVCLAAAWALPALAMGRLVPALGAGPLVRNYRGVELPAGLGAVWPLWAVLVTLAGELLAVIALAIAGSAPVVTALQLQSPRLLTIPALLAVGAFAFGSLDDVFGTSADKGFRGHVRALRQGRLTTGGLKLLGIGLLAATAVTPAVPDPATLENWLATLGVWVLDVLAIALTANLVNLLDLRPGRALKGYAALVVFAVLVGAVRWYGLARGDESAPVIAGWLLLGWLVVYLGPVLAVWRLDLGEKAMLGDAGANPAGAIAGFLVAAALPWWALLVYVGLVLYANLASERHSFSAVIERSTTLKWIDGLGRLPVDEDVEGPATRSRDDG